MYKCFFYCLCLTPHVRTATGCSVIVPISVDLNRYLEDLVYNPIIKIKHLYSPAHNFSGSTTPPNDLLISFLSAVCFYLSDEKLVLPFVRC